jgi:heme exporter protein C
MKFSWWKILAVALTAYAIAAGFLFKVPQLPILHETIRNLYFHVTMWFSMILLLCISFYSSIRYLATNKQYNDILASEAARVGVVLGIAGILTGSVWARYTWGAWWVNDMKLNGAASALLVYFAYLLLRNAINDPQKKARIAAVYNIFAFVLMIVLMLILPRLTDSLHPGSGGNPGFNVYDLDSNMRMVFYPAVTGWFLLSVWMLNLLVRYQKLKNHAYQI